MSSDIPAKVFDCRDVVYRLACTDGHLFCSSDPHTTCCPGCGKPARVLSVQTGWDLYRDSSRDRFGPEIWGAIGKFKRRSGRFINVGNLAGDIHSDPDDFPHLRDCATQRLLHLCFAEFTISGLVKWSNSSNVWVIPNNSGISQDLGMPAPEEVTA